jgi:hypothetical protein
MNIQQVAGRPVVGYIKATMCLRPQAIFKLGYNPFKRMVVIKEYCRLRPFFVCDVLKYNAVGHLYVVFAGVSF